MALDIVSSVFALYVGLSGGNVGVGSAVLIAPQYALTAAHVVCDSAGAEGAIVRLNSGDGRTMWGKVEKCGEHFPSKPNYRIIDVKNDWALVRLNKVATGIPYIEIADSASRSIDQANIAGCHPITSKVGDLQHRNGGCSLKNLAGAATYDAINNLVKVPAASKGMSGGPAFIEQDGRPYIIGILSARSDDTGQGYAAPIPSDLLSYVHD